MIIPLWVHEKKDKSIIDFLNTQTNKSATIRTAIYNYMRGIEYKPNIIPDNLNNDFMNSLNVFDRDD